MRVHPAAHQTAVTAAATLTMTNTPERKPRRRGREGGTRPATAALTESRAKNAPTVWTPNTHIPNTVEERQKARTAERDGGRTKREVKINTGAGVGRGGEKEAGAEARSEGEMRKKEVRRGAGARAGRKETGVENRGKEAEVGNERETVIEMSKGGVSVGNEGGAQKNTAEVMAEMQRGRNE